jgi:hypothetical protein
MGVATAAVYLGPDPKKPGSFLSVDRGGHVRSMKNNDITYVKPYLVSADACQAFLASDYSQETGSPLIQALRTLEVALEKTRIMLVAAGANDLYSSVMRKGSKTGPKAITTQGAINALHLPAFAGSPTRFMERETTLHLAMHRILMLAPENFIADPLTHRTTGNFTIRTPAEVADFKTVQAWVRSPSLSIPLQVFASKAARAKAWAIAHPPLPPVSSNSELVKVKKEDVGIEWDNNDQMILRILERALGQQRLLQSHPYMILAPEIIKLVDEHFKRLDSPSEDVIPTPESKADESSFALSDRQIINREEVMSFLSEIGVAAPWENWVAQEEEAGLMEWKSKDPRPRLSPSSASTPAPARRPSTINTKSLSPTEFYPIDPHDSVRHDFGQLPVYTIDDPGAAELDDGVSISSCDLLTVTGGPTYWTHIHVADPTALLHPNHEISQVARRRNHSEYFPEQKWSMLPAWFMTGKGMSLGSKIGGVEEKTLTFSMRLDDEANVLETKVQVGIVRNVKRLTYGAVDKVLGYIPPTAGHLITLNKPLSSSNGKYQPPMQRMTDDKDLLVDTKAVTDLSTLHRLSAALERKRAEGGALFWSFSSSSVSVSPRIQHINLAIDPTSPTFYSTSPNIALQLPSQQALGGSSPASTLVAEFMVLANRTAAQFCVEHNLPVPYRSQRRPAGVENALEEVMALRSSNGQIDAIEILKRGITFTAASDGIAPLPHWPMGIQDQFGYVKATSPLRRYSDMILHWQIKSILLPTSSATSPPFTKSAVINLIKETESVTRARGRIDRHAVTFWTLYLLREKLNQMVNPSKATIEDSETDEILRNLNGLVLDKPIFSLFTANWVSSVHIVELGIRAYLFTQSEEEMAAIGSVVPVKFREIQLSGRSRAVVVLR